MLGIIHGPDGIAVYVDGETVQYNPSDQLNVNLGDAIVKGPNGISVNTDDVDHQGERQRPVGAIANFTAGPGIVVDSGTNAPSTIIQVDTGAGIITTADGIAANVDGVSQLW